jgi:hypothetical protein
MDPGDATVVVSMVLPAERAPPLPGIQPYEVWYVQGTTNADVTQNYQARADSRRRRAAALLGLMDDQPNPEFAVVGDGRPAEHIREADRRLARVYLMLVMIPVLLLVGLILTMVLMGLSR